MTWAERWERFAVLCRERIGRVEHDPRTCGSCGLDFARLLWLEKRAHERSSRAGRAGKGER